MYVTIRSDHECCFSGTLQGRFTSDGTPKFIPLRTDVDWIFVRNQTVSYATGADTGAEFYWQRGDLNGQGTIYIKTVNTEALQVGQIGVNEGFFLTNTALTVPGPSTALTGISAGGGGHNSPQVATGDTQGLPVAAVVGNHNPAGIVRIFNTVGARQLGGIDFSVANVVNNTSFDLIYMNQIAAAVPGAGTYRVIPFDPIYYPRRRFISKISQANQAIVTLTVTHGYAVGQKVRLIVPEITAQRYGMTALNDKLVTIVAVNQPDADGATNTITIDVDTNGLTAFAFPLTTDPAFTPAQVVPVGEDTAQANSAIVNPFSGATFNTAQLGILLQAGTLSPAGVDGDVITWVAGKSFNA